MNRILCIGSSSHDMFFPTREGEILETPSDLTAQRKIAFELGAKFHVEERFEALGGCAANTATGLAKLGIESGCYSMVGKDVLGEWIRHEMDRHGVDTTLVGVGDCYSDLSSIIVDIASGERIIFSNQRANKLLKVNQERIGTPQWIFIADLSGEWEWNVDEIVAVAEKHGIKLAFNPRQKTIHDNVRKIIFTISRCEVIFLNKDEAIEIVSGGESKYSQNDLNDEKTLLIALKNLGAKIVTVTDGIRGAWAYDGTTLVHADSLKVEAKDSTGAGDAFASGFMGALLSGKDLATCVKWGIANSSNVVMHYGAIEGLCTVAEIESHANAVNTKIME